MIHNNKKNPWSLEDCLRDDLFTLSHQCEDSRIDGNRSVSESSWGVVWSLHGEPFWVGCGFSNRPIFYVICYVLYIIYWVVKVSLYHPSNHCKRCPLASIPWSDTWFRQHDDLLPHIDDDVRTCCTSFHHNSSEQLVTMVTLFNVYLCMQIIILWTGGGTYDKVLHNVKGVWGMGIRIHTTYIQPTYIPHTYKSFF